MSGRKRQSGQSLGYLFDAGPAQEVIRDSDAARDRLPSGSRQGANYSEGPPAGDGTFAGKEIETISVPPLHGLQIDLVEKIRPPFLLLERFESAAREPLDVASMVAAVRGAPPS